MGVILSAVCANWSGFADKARSVTTKRHLDAGGPARYFLNLENGEPPTRFFYCGKASKKERRPYNIHPTCKPLKLLEYLVKLITPPKPGILLDPFAGSGSTLVACKNLGVPFIGIELEPEYVEIAKKRLSGE